MSESVSELVSQWVSLDVLYITCKCVICTQQNDSTVRIDTYFHSVP